MSVKCGSGMYSIHWSKKITKKVRGLYLFGLLVHFQKLAVLPSPWHTHASRMSVRTVNQSRLTFWNYRQLLCIVFASSDKHLFIDFTNTMYSTQHKDKNKSVRNLPQLKGSKLWEGHCLHSLPYPYCGLLPAGKFAKSLYPSYHCYCLPVGSWWFQWLTCELQWLE